MEIYTQVASWTGWPAVVAMLLLAIGFGAWIFTQRIEFWKDNFETEKNKSPDATLKALKENYEIQDKLIQKYMVENAQDKAEISSLQESLRILKIKIKKFEKQVEDVKFLKTDTSGSSIDVYNKFIDTINKASQVINIPNTPTNDYLIKSEILKEKILDSINDERKLDLYPELRDDWEELKK